MGCGQARECKGANARNGRGGLAEPRIRIVPSLLAADFAELAGQIRQVEQGGADALHLDVMDGHFVPNLSFGVPVIESIRKVSRLLFDTHLMIREPLRYAEAFVRAGSDSITFHVEAADEPARLIDHIRSLGVGVGVCLNPATPADAIFDVLDRVDLVLVMSVWPGFGGQEFIEDMLGKIASIRPRLRPDQRLEVDGGINLQTIGRCARAGADMFVAGSAVFGASDPSAAIAALRQAAETQQEPQDDHGR